MCCACVVRVLCMCCACAVRACAHAVALVEARGQLLRAGFPSAMSGSGGVSLTGFYYSTTYSGKLAPDLLSSPPTSL